MGVDYSRRLIGPRQDANRQKKALFRASGMAARAGMPLGWGKAVALT
jgi:hypothetical protein